MTSYDFLVVGAGIYGITTALELNKRGYRVGVINPDQIPHPLASSTDISKVIRMEYGTDLLYMEMVDQAIDTWHTWNDEFGEELYHEVGFLLLCRSPMDARGDSWDWTSYQNLIARGHTPDRLDSAALAERFPAFSNAYIDGFYHARAGYAESGRVVAALTDQARARGVTIHEGQTADEILTADGAATGVRTREGETFNAGHVIVCAGAHTPYLLPELQAVMRVTGHPVFHLKPSTPAPYTAREFPVFSADIAYSGWYGFPLHPHENVVKIANHGPGLRLHPEDDERVVTDADEVKFRSFLIDGIPSLVDEPIVYTRRCVYTDTLDGHFWIDQHPEIKGLSVGTGGSGHGFKFAPVLGELIASAAFGDDHPWLERFRWRELSEEAASNEEESRFLVEDAQ